MVWEFQKVKIAGNAEFKKFEFVATLDLLALKSVATPAVLAIFRWVPTGCACYSQFGYPSDLLAIRKCPYTGFACYPHVSVHWLCLLI